MFTNPSEADSYHATSSNVIPFDSTHVNSSEASIGLLCNPDSQAFGNKMNSMNFIKHLQVNDESDKLIARGKQKQ